MLAMKKISSRQRILQAARELAREVGPAHLSLDAVAERAGLSKGGLLYSFPTKAKLLEAVVEDYMNEHEQALNVQQKLQQGDNNRLARAYLDVYRLQADEEPAACGVLAALAEDPDFMRPIRKYHRALVDRLQQDSNRPVNALVAYLAIAGLETSKLLDCEVLTEEERHGVLCYLETMLTAD